MKYKIMNNLTEEELQRLAEFKKMSIAQNIDDHYLMVYLFAKKLNVEKAAETLQNNIDLRSKLGIPFPLRKAQVNVDIVKKMYSFFIPDTRDANGRVIAYLYPSKMIPKQYDFVDCMKILFWFSDITVYEDSIGHRNGMVVVEDLTKVSMKNFDSRLTDMMKGKSLENIFPGRIEAIYLINQPWFLRFLIGFAKTFIKNKIVKRLKIVGKKEKMVEFVDPNHLLEEFGGKLNFDYHGWIDSLPADY
ncbi:CRAL/TRIO domain-containing protein [Heterostelium album PN500]|uniref:CRAL/TRIO domain-containing protein n=1 Tax=Heterostelium pallidum (strain ATCC 26659 / Pp 5 / PN500) TaxID=670386 RepID=D3BJW9_HETP5|nr:CRAL/TRIO domain-containing protein [Heterostelium album PN500]EFA78199.1 CRAL/TRIO domain-containing protein [Heterostelium album PN500]|eukprot:XP_020430325.1 CRAL/TRIO domain-containing protein [Heterostelium album PN500]